MTTICSFTADKADTLAPSPADTVLTSILITFLTPLFLTPGGELRLARLAAAETVAAYQPRHAMDLIAVVQIIGFGLASLGSLSLSMGADLSLSMILRLRSNAAALGRLAEQQRRALEKVRQADQALFDWPTNPVARDAAEQARYEAQVLDNVRQAQAMVEQANTQMAQQADGAFAASAPQPGATKPVVETATVGATTQASVMACKPATAASIEAVDQAPAERSGAAVDRGPAVVVAVQAATTDPLPQGLSSGSPRTVGSDLPQQTAAHAPMTREQQQKALWANAMTVVAAEYAAEMAALPANERWQAAVRADALGSAAAALMGRPEASATGSATLG